MTAAEIASLVFRWLHILAGMTAVGGTIFVRFVLLPSQGVLAPKQREELHALMRARWSKIVAGAIGLLLVSGLYNFLWFIHTKESLPSWYHPLFGVKVVLALVVFLVASLLSGKTAAAQKLRQRASFWMSLNIVLAIAIVCISGVLRTAHVPKMPQNSRPTDQKAAAPDQPEA